MTLQNCQTNPASGQHLLGLHCYDKWNTLDACGNAVGIGQCFLVRLDLWQTKGPVHCLSSVLSPFTCLHCQFIRFRRLLQHHCMLSWQFCTCVTLASDLGYHPRNTQQMSSAPTLNRMVTTAVCGLHTRVLKRTVQKQPARLFQDMDLKTPSDALKFRCICLFCAMP